MSNKPDENKIPTTWGYTETRSPEEIARQNAEGGEVAVDSTKVAGLRDETAGEIRVAGRPEGRGVDVRMVGFDSLLKSIDSGEYKGAKGKLTRVVNLLKRKRSEMDVIIEEHRNGYGSEGSIVNATGKMADLDQVINHLSKQVELMPDKTGIGNLDVGKLKQTRQLLGILLPDFNKGQRGYRKRMEAAENAKANAGSGEVEKYTNGGKPSTALSRIEVVDGEVIDQGTEDFTSGSKRFDALLDAIKSGEVDKVQLVLKETLSFLLSEMNRLKTTIHESKKKNYEIEGIQNFDKSLLALRNAFRLIKREFKEFETSGSISGVNAKAWEVVMQNLAVLFKELSEDKKMYADWKKGGTATPSSKTTEPDKIDSSTEGLGKVMHYIVVGERSKVKPILLQVINLLNPRHSDMFANLQACKSEGYDATETANLEVVVGLVKGIITQLEAIHKDGKGMFSSKKGFRKWIKMKSNLDFAFEAFDKHVQLYDTWKAAPTSAYKISSLGNDGIRDSGELAHTTAALKKIIENVEDGRVDGLRETLKEWIEKRLDTRLRGLTKMIEDMESEGNDSGVLADIKRNLETLKLAADELEVLIDKAATDGDIDIAELRDLEVIVGTTIKNTNNLAGPYLKRKRDKKDGFLDPDLLSKVDSTSASNVAKGATPPAIPANPNNPFAPNNPTTQTILQKQPSLNVAVGSQESVDDKMIESLFSDMGVEVDDFESDKSMVAKVTSKGTDLSVAYLMHAYHHLTTGGGSTVEDKLKRRLSSVLKKADVKYIEDTHDEMMSTAMDSIRKAVGKYNESKEGSDSAGEEYYHLKLKQIDKMHEMGKIADRIYNVRKKNILEDAVKNGVSVEDPGDKEVEDNLSTSFGDRLKARAKTKAVDTGYALGDTATAGALKYAKLGAKSAAWGSLAAVTKPLTRGGMFVFRKFRNGMLRAGFLAGNILAVAGMAIAKPFSWLASLVSEKAAFSLTENYAKLRAKEKAVIENLHKSEDSWIEQRKGAQKGRAGRYMKEVYAKESGLAKEFKKGLEDKRKEAEKVEKNAEDAKKKGDNDVLADELSQLTERIGELKGGMKFKGSRASLAVLTSILKSSKEEMKAA
ncbi:hypothetical protein JKY72_06440 [Candidatus Gracilibacteria bacterium]|nr:hypothetical protein [Candidatus Gracilibacteria bacterium]